MTPPSSNARSPRVHGRPPAFTLIETVIVVIIIGVLASLAFVVLGKVVRSSRSTAQRAALISIRMGVDSFKKDFEMYPPLVDDTNPVGPAPARAPRIRDNAFLSSQVNPNDPRYSVYSLPYYILGALGADVDGVAGAGFTRPQPDGSFMRRGQRFEPYFDTARNPEQLDRDPADETHVRLLDRWKNPIRFYRWLPKRFPMNGGAIAGTVDQYYVPRAVGDPNLSEPLRNASYAIVSIGPDGETDELKPLPTQLRTDGATDATAINKRITDDDIVEVEK